MLFGSRFRWLISIFHTPDRPCSGSVMRRVLVAPRIGTTRKSPTPAGVVPPAKGAGLE